MKDCRFCSLQKNTDMTYNKDTILHKTNNFFSISSVGALVEGWSLVIPCEHCCSMKDLYNDQNFIKFTNEMIASLHEFYGSIIAFEHGPNREDSETSCGTNHAHLHLVPFNSISKNLNNDGRQWINCKASEVQNLVGDNEYLFYCEIDKNCRWDDPIGLLHILNNPISQFFRRVIAQEIGCADKFNYKTDPDCTLTMRTVERLHRYFNMKSGG